MIFPDNTNPAFVAWYNTRPADVRAAIDGAWAATASGVFPGHRSAEHARLTFLIAHCRQAYGYAG